MCDLPLLTSYDGSSIMNYCASEYGRENTDYHPTQKDLLGMQLLYPGSLTNHKLACRNACVDLGSDNVVVGTGGTIVSDWTALGALNIVPTWQVGSWIGTSEVLASGKIANGAVTYSYQDGDKQYHFGSGVVTISDSILAGVLQTATMAMML
jgi:hypothetical protein